MQNREAPRWRTRAAHQLPAPRFTQGCLDQRRELQTSGPPVPVKSTAGRVPFGSRVWSKSDNPSKTPKATEPDGRPVEIIQDAGAVHRAPGSRPGRGGQVLPGEKGLGFPKKPSHTVERLVSKPLHAGVPTLSAKAETASDQPFRKSRFSWEGQQCQSLVLQRRIARKGS